MGFHKVIKLFGKLPSGEKKPAKKPVKHSRRQKVKCAKCAASIESNKKGTFFMCNLCDEPLHTKYSCSGWTEAEMKEFVECTMNAAIGSNHIKCYSKLCGICGKLTSPTYSRRICLPSLKRKQNK